MDAQQVNEWFVQSGLRILIILLAALIAYRLLGMLTRYLSRRIQEIDGVEGSELDRRTVTIFDVVHSTGVVLIVGTAALMILTELGVPITPVLASVGFVGLAFGLGAQALVKDIISGIFILIENQYTVGDTVEISGLVGTVEDMTLRITCLRDLHGTLHIIPNGEIRIVANRSRDWSRAIVDVGITYEEDVDTALGTLKAIGAALVQDETVGPFLLETPVVTGVEGLDDWAVRLRIMVKTMPDQQWEVQRHLRRRIQQVFRQEGLDLAFPRRDVMVLKAD